jgi:GR25 family glycosyltransferase involved in LPS biosynthesis
MRHCSRADVAGIAAIVAIAIFTAIITTLLFLVQQQQQQPPPQATEGRSRDKFQTIKEASSSSSDIRPLHQMPSYILTLNAEGSRVLADATMQYLTYAEPRLWRALNGTEALHASEAKLPLYTRLALAAGRHDHMQIGTPEMLACLLGHTAIWRDVQKRGLAEALVLEEDAFIDETSAERVVQLLNDAAAEARQMQHSQREYDVIMLDQGHITVSGATRAVGVLGRTWAQPDDARHNRWMGTRGYIVRASALPRLLKHADNLDVQVDAVLNLAVVFDGVRMLWPALDVAQPSLLRLSMVRGRDPCIKCFVSADSGQVVISLLLFMALVGVASIIVRYRGLTAAWSALGSTSSQASPSQPSTCSANC